MWEEVCKERKWTWKHCHFLPWRLQSTLQTCQHWECPSGPFGTIWCLLRPLLGSCFQIWGQFCVCNYFPVSWSLILGVQIPLILFCQTEDDAHSSSGWCLRGHIHFRDSKGMYFKYPFSPGQVLIYLFSPGQVIYLAHCCSTISLYSDSDSPGPETLEKTFNPLTTDRCLQLP